LIKLLERRYSNRLKKEFDEGTKAETKQKQRKRTKKRSLISTENELASNEPAVMDYDEFGIYDMDEDEQDAMAFADLGDDNFDSMPCTFPPLICLPLYSLLPAHLQKRVFESTAPDNGSRLI
jgi:HrpA-like RNA helicase